MNGWMSDWLKDPLKKTMHWKVFLDDDLLVTEFQRMPYNVDYI